MICLRCNREFSDPVPKEAFPGGAKEIASSEWCADCNAYTMSLIYRDSSAYRPREGKEQLQPPRILISQETISAIFTKRPLCVCGATAYVWDGEKSTCFACLEKEQDFKRGYAYSPDGVRRVTLEEKYGKL